jgi:hypothetical protein
MLGPPQSTKRGGLRYCLTRGGSLLIGERGRQARTVFASTTSPGFTLRGARGRAVKLGAEARRLRAAFPRSKPLLTLGRTSVLQALGASGSAKPGTVIAAIVAGHVAWLGVYEAGAIRTPRALAGYLRSTT